jgi:hypothetical protein
MTYDIPILRIRHANGEPWKVAATWPDGRFEEIEGFNTESEANEWVARSLRAWLDESLGDFEPTPIARPAGW